MGVTFSANGYKFVQFGQGGISNRKSCASLGRLLVQSGAYDGGHKMSEVRGSFVELEPTNHAVVGEIFCDARFGNAEMFGELRLEGIRAATTCAAPQKISDSD